MLVSCSAFSFEILCFSSAGVWVIKPGRGKRLLKSSLTVRANSVLSPASLCLAANLLLVNKSTAHRQGLSMWVPWADPRHAAYVLSPGSALYRVIDATCAVDGV